MALALSKEQQTVAVSALQAYFTKNLDRELSHLQAGLLLDFVMTEFGPFAYNQGVEDAQKFLTRFTEDLSGTCFQEPLTQWKKQSETSRMVARKPSR